MFSPDAVPSSIASRNPRRRQRNASEDSVAIKPNPKRPRRTELTPDLFVAPPTEHTNGKVKLPLIHPTANGYTNKASQRDAAIDATKFQIRSKEGKKPDRSRRNSRGEGGTQLVRHLGLVAHSKEAYSTSYRLKTNITSSLNCPPPQTA